MYQVIAKMKGSELVGKGYKPMFPFFSSLKAQPGSDTGSFRVVSDTYVTADAGTGIVHQAPFFGEDDYRVCRKFGESRSARHHVIVCSQKHCTHTHAAFGVVSLCDQSCSTSDCLHM